MKKYVKPSLEATTLHVEPLLIGSVTIKNEYSGNQALSKQTDAFGLWEEEDNTIDE